MKKSNFILILILFFTILFSEEIPITILHTNDIHGQMHPFHYKNKSMDYENIGGVARRGTLINTIREENKHKTFLFDIGDIAGRGEYKEYYAEPEIKIMNYLKYDLMTLGNHEFKIYEGTDLPKEEALTVLNKRIREAKFPVLCANVYKNNKRLFKPYVIFNEKNIKIAVVGMTTPKIKNYPIEIEYSDPNAEFKKVLEELKGKYDILIFASHLGDPIDYALGNIYPEIDVIIEGDLHNFLAKEGSIPNKSKKIGKTILCQTGELGVMLGRIDLQIDSDTKEISSYKYELIPITDKYKEDTKINEILSKYVSNNNKPVVASLN